MNEFKKRFSKGNQLQNEFLAWLNDNGINYLLSGYEHQTGSINAKALIGAQNNNTALFVRHYPDTTIITINHTVLVEVKNSSGIEKGCYDTYMNLKEKLNLHILLFCKNKMLCKIEDLIFRKMKYFDEISNMSVPVIDDVWRNPRAMNNRDYRQYLDAYSRANKYTSGSTFAFIDFEKTRFVPLEKLLSLL